MSESDLPIMPVFVKDWIAGVLHWTDAERGAYFSLLAHQWVNRCIPADEAQLARIMGTPEKDFEARWHVIGKKFDGDEDGLFNNRLEEHRKKAIELRNSKIRAAGAANAVRRAKKAHRIAAANAERVPHDVPRVDAVRTHTSTSTSTSTKEEIREEREHEREGESSERSAFAERASRETYKNYWNDEKWIDYKLRMPNRAGGQDDVGAKKAWRARLREGHTWDELLSGADRYNAYCVAAGKVGTEYVMQRKTFCGPGKRFLEEWEIPAEVGGNGAWTPPSDEVDSIP
jgi:uncharacterized protein YdaU (DUF1376 family)